MFTRRKLILAVMTVSALLAFSVCAHGQTCRGSNLTYIVRGQRGDAIDAESKGLSYAPEATSQGRWGASGRDFINKTKGGYSKGTSAKFTDQLPTKVGKLNGQVRALETSAMCNFHDALVRLELEFNGMKMSLFFQPPRLNSQESMNFLVDSLPFQEGSFAIELPKNDDYGGSRFYAAEEWRKITTAEQLYIEGEAALLDSNYEKAVDYLKRAASLKPDNAMTFRYLGFAYLETKQYAEAVAALKQSTKLNANSALAYKLLGDALSRTDKNKEAVDAYSQALRLGSTDKEWDKDSDQETRQALKRAQDALQNDLSAEGVHYLESEKYSEAVATFNEIVRMRPGDYEAFSLLGVAYFKLKRYPEAVAALKESTRLAPNYDPAWGGLGDTYLAQGRKQDAIEAYTEALRLAPKEARWRDGLKRATMP